MNETTRKAIKIIDGDAWNLSGPRWKKTRQAIIFDITGVKQPLAKSGCVALENILVGKAQIDTTSKCYAEIKNDLKTWAKNL